MLICLFAKEANSGAWSSTADKTAGHAAVTVAQGQILQILQILQMSILLVSW